MTPIEVYTKLSKPDPGALKQIRGGRLNGKTDINPQWRYKAMTEQFGLCGIGWKYTIDKQWIEKGEGVEVMAFVNVSVYVKDGDKWSDPIPGTGGSMLVTKEKNGPYNSDEAFKMATTDALSVALKFLGVAAAIYSGQWDGTKYIGEYADPPRELPAEVYDWESVLSTSSSKEELQKNWAAATAKYGKDVEAMKILTAAKNAKKKELGL